MPLPSLKDQFAALIAAPSVSCTQPALDQSNRPVIDLLAGWLGDLGFKCDIQQVSPGKFNLLASRGTGPGGLVLAGHSDTVPYDEQLWASDPLKLTEVDGRWVGLGSCDMKGFFALVIEAVIPLLEHDFKQPLLILATCDEESSMSGARALAEAGQPLGRAAVIGEPTGLKPIRMHKGILMDRIDILGRSGHSSDPRLGHSALEAMHDAMGELMSLRLHWQKVPQSPVQRAAADHEFRLHPRRRQPQPHLRPVFAGIRPAAAAGHGPRATARGHSRKLNPLAERHQVRSTTRRCSPRCRRSSRPKTPNWCRSRNA
jgi:acetylornithine deacetylase